MQAANPRSHEEFTMDTMDTKGTKGTMDTKGTKGTMSARGPHDLDKPERVRREY